MTNIPCGFVNTVKKHLLPVGPTMSFAALSARINIMCIRIEEKTNKKNISKTRVLTQTGDEKYAQQFF